MNVKLCISLTALLLMYLPAVLRGSPVVVGASPKESVVNSAGPSDTTFSAALSSVNPWSLALHPETNRVYFSDPTAGRIASFDRSSPTVVTSLIKRPGSVFHGIWLDGPNNQLYFLDSSNDSVNRIDLDTLDETEIFAGAPIIRPNSVVYSAELGRIVVTDSGADAIHVLDPDLPSPLIASYSSADKNGAWGVAIDPVYQTLYFSSYEDGSIYLMDINTGSTKLISSGLSGPRGLKFDRKGELYCFEDGTGQISIINLPDGTKGPTFYGTATSGRGFIIFDDKDRDNDLLDDSWELQYASSLFTLGAGSDPDGDSKTALYELLFRGSPQVSGDSAPVQSFKPDAGGLVDLEFDAPTEGYQIQIWLSSDLQSSWQLYNSVFNKVEIPGTIYSQWTTTLDPVALGLDADQLFIQLTGDAL